MQDACDLASCVLQLHGRGQAGVGAQVRWCQIHSACMLQAGVELMNAMAPIRLPAAVMCVVPALQSAALIRSVLLQAGRMGSGERSVGPVLRIPMPCECLLLSTLNAYFRTLSHTCWQSLLYLQWHSWQLYVDGLPLKHKGSP